MKKQRTTAAIVAILAFLALKPTDAAAQYCYNFCLQTCGLMGYYKGEQESSWGVNGPFCRLSDCASCPFESVEEGPSVTEISDLLQTSDNLASVVNLHRDRLLLSPGRNMVAIKGGCTGDAAVSVVFVEPARMEALARLDVATLESHLSTVAGS